MTTDEQIAFVLDITARAAKQVIEKIKSGNLDAPTKRALGGWIIIEVREVWDDLTVRASHKELEQP